MTQIKGVSRIVPLDEKNYTPQLIIHVKDSYDMILRISDDDSLESIVKALKYLFWKAKKLNLPIYS